MIIDLHIPAHDTTSPDRTPMRWALILGGGQAPVLRVEQQVAPYLHHILGEWAPTGGSWGMSDLRHDRDTIPIDLGQRWLAYNVGAAVAGAAAILAANP